MFINTWLDKEDVMCIYNEILAIKKQSNSAICNNMDGTGDYYA